MKKVLFVVAVAAFAMTACTNEKNEYVGENNNSPKEIAFNALAQPATRSGAVSNSTFPDYSMRVVAYDLTNTRNYFGTSTGIQFIKNYQGGTASASDDKWGGNPPQYWPLTPSTLNFLGVTESNVADVSSTITFNATTPASAATVALDDNYPKVGSSYAQHDLMYAAGRGTVSSSGTNGLSYSGGSGQTVDMVFKHALAWVDFKVVAAANYNTPIYLRSIVLKDAYYGGTYTITNDNYNSSSTTLVDNVTGSWGTSTTTLTDKGDYTVPGWTSGTVVPYSSSTTVGDGLLVVPTNGIVNGSQQNEPSFTGFTVNYTLNGNNYSYTYTLAPQLSQATHYTYTITFSLTEIRVSPSVSPWGTSDSGISVPGA